MDGEILQALAAKLESRDTTILERYNMAMYVAFQGLGRKETKEAINKIMEEENKFGITTPTKR